MPPRTQTKYQYAQLYHHSKARQSTVWLQIWYFHTTILPTFKNWNMHCIHETYVLVVYSINNIFIDNKIINIKVSQIWINTARLYSNKLSHSWECLPSFCTLLFIKSTSSSDSVSVSPTWWWRCDVGLTSSNCDCKASI